SDVSGTHNQWDMAKQKFVDEPVTRRNTENPFLGFLQTGMTANNNISVTGNYDKGSFRMSYSNMTNKGVIPSSKTIRNTVSFDAQYKVTNKLKVSGNAQYINTYAPNKHILAGRGDVKYSSVLYNIVASTADKQPFSDWKTPWITNAEGLLQNNPYMDFENYLGNGDETDRANYRPYKAVNPYFIGSEIVNTYLRGTFIGKVQVEYDILENLKLTGRSGLNSTSFNFQKRYPWNINKYLLDGLFSTQDSQNTRINTDIFLTYSKTFGKFSVDALGGYNFRITNNQYTSQGGEHLARPNDFSIRAISKDNLVTSYSWSTGKYSSLYGTASLGFNNMLYLDLSVRKDYVGITELEKNNSLYPGGSLSWLASETFEMPGWVSMFKIRGGIAQVGYGIPTYLNVDNYGFSSTWNGTTVGTVYGSVVNPDILPEVNTTYEAGFDSRFFDSRVNLNFTWFKKVHANQIQDIPIVSSSGFSSYRTNIGTVTSDGLELELTLVPVRTANWEWSVNANFTKYVATITELDPAFTEKWIGYGDGSMLRLKEGEEIGNMYAEEGFWRVQSGIYKGKIMLKPDTGTPIENDDPDNRDFLGNMNPDFMMGFNTNLRYKSFSLNMVMSYRSGGVYVSETFKRMNDDGKTPWSLSGDGYYWEGGRSHSGGFAWPDPNDVVFDVVRETNEAYGFVDEASYWNGVYVDPTSDYDSQDRNLPDAAYVLNGEDPNTTWYHVVPKIVGNTWDFPQTRTFDATYFKIRDISLTYNIPRSIVGKIKMQAASVSFIARNVFLWTKSGRNEDPETAFSGSGTTQGVAHYTLPSIRQLGFKLNLTF
ncbi:MAG: TonB-dependent receptor, partial [Bacteroidales bacterium]|nr:TonB-dependent receptor [Bacteroidales bacterium]